LSWGGRRAFGFGHRARRQWLYGVGNHDVAGDEIAYWARSFAGQRPIVGISFNNDTTHTNPWYHELVVVIDSIDDDVYDALVNRLTWEGLIEPPR